MKTGFPSFLCYTSQKLLSAFLCTHEGLKGESTISKFTYCCQIAGIMIMYHYVRLNLLQIVYSYSQDELALL